MVTRTGLSQFASDISRGYSIENNTPNNFVFVEVKYIVLSDNNPSKEAFNKVGGWNGIGTIFYKEYSSTSGSEDLNMSTAVPFDPNIKHYPQPGEIVLIIKGPSYKGKTVDKMYGKNYYLGPFNVWNSSQYNSLSTPSNTGTFIENADIRPLRPFEGDLLIQGRKNNGIRFGTTVSEESNNNEWSTPTGIGANGDPIIILVNGYVTTDNKSLAPNIEEVNKEMSSIYMTSTQLIPLIPDRTDILNPVTHPLSPSKYIDGSQIILNSDRVTLNSKKDEVMIFAKTNVEISTNNIINLNAGFYTHINSPKVFIGVTNDTSFHHEPLLLGNKTVTLLTNLLKILGDLGNSLTETITNPTGAPATTLNGAGSKLVGDLKSLQEQLKTIVSSNNFTT